MRNIREALLRHFERHQIVFWYDVKRDMREEYEVVELPNIEKIELLGDEFGIKYRVLREQPVQKFLLYHEGPPPADIDNWLLDVQLANEVFRTDKGGLWLSELGLGFEFADVVQAHADFFNAVKRCESLKSLLEKNEIKSRIRLKMLAVCASAGPRIDEIMESLLAELADSRDEKIRLIERCGLAPVLWEQLERSYGYTSDSPGVKDFALQLFKNCYRMGTDGPVDMHPDSLVFLKRWKNSRTCGKAFETLSEKFAGTLGIEEKLIDRDFRKLVDLDYFQLIDRKILSDLVKNVSARTITAGDCSNIVWQRRQSFWYDKFENLYEAVNYAAQFIHSLAEEKLLMDSLAEGVGHYCRTWYTLDQLYRKFVYHVRQARQSTLMEQLAEQIENLYSNTFLLKMNDAWQKHVDAAEQWSVPGTYPQREFFDRRIKPFLEKDNKVFVIISDALRYEIGEELLSLVRQEDRYEGEIEPMLAMLPSYTQLGMAALLPNTELRIADDESGTVFVDGHSSQGTSNRSKILDQAVAGTGRAVRADEFINMNRDDCRAFIREHDVIYVYHNQIDATGDKKESEERVFEAAEETLQALVKIIKKLAGANANNMIVTADHGFIYQNRALDESDFSGGEAAGDTVLLKDRRFVVGKGLKEQLGLRTFNAAALGLEGDLEIQVPKSINRLRKSGAGSRYVHGGASLQEVIVPVVRINKKRRSDVTSVNVDILRGSSAIITSGQLAVAFYQREPVSEKVQSCTLRAGIYTHDGELISDSHELTFNLDSENPRERELPVRFILTRKADEANGQEVVLKLEEREPGTSHYGVYKSVKYVMRRSFTTDFDF